MTGDPIDAMSHEQPLIVVMGVSAAGKSTVAAALAARLNTPWLDADDLHPVPNLEKMAAGVPLDDSDRWPWLDLVGDTLAVAARRDGIVIACSALRQTYRDHLRASAHGVRFLHLHGTRELLLSRAAARHDHFMPASLLDSQISALEPLRGGEPGARFDVALPVDDVVEAALAWMAVSPAAHTDHITRNATPAPGAGGTAEHRLSVADDERTSEGTES
nr:gluconokinase [Microbacterium lemovicicum]